MLKDAALRTLIYLIVSLKVLALALIVYNLR